MSPIPPAITCVGAPGDAAGGWGCRESAHGWTVLDLHGTDEAMGRAWAGLVGQELEADYVPMLEHEHWGALPGVFRHLLAHHLRHFDGYFDARASARAAGVEAALGWRSGTVLRYAWMSDLGSIGPAVQLALAGTVQRDGVDGLVTDRCTSVIGRDGDATVHARNLDYWGMGFWQPHATLTFVEPLDPQGRPDGHRFVHVGTLGELFAGTTGVNEQGVVISTHLHVTRDVALTFGRMRMSGASLLWEGLSGRHPREGTSVYVLVERALRDAADVDEAVALLEATPPVGAWSFVVSDPTGDSAVVNADWRERRTLRGARVHTNRFEDPGMGARELVPARGPVEGSDLRWARASELLGDGALDVASAVALLRDRRDLAVGRDRAVSANSVVSPDASQSVVVRSAPGRAPELWLADPWPDGYTPAPFASFHALSFEEGFPASGPGARSARAWGGELAGAPVPDGLPEWLEAMRLALDVHDRDAAAEHLWTHPPADPGLSLVSAVALAARGRTGDASTRLAAVDRASLSHHHAVLAAWLEGELAWRAGDRAAAEAAWRAGIGLTRAGDRPELDALLARVLEDRLGCLDRRPRAAIPFPDLKFQDVIELRTACGER